MAVLKTPPPEMAPQPPSSSHNKGLWLILVFLVTLLLACTGLSIGLTFLPCYSTFCSEAYFPYATRVHIAVFYASLAILLLALLARRWSSKLLAVSQHRLIPRELPILNKRITVGGLALAVWIAATALITISFWIQPELSYWALRADPLDWAAAKIRISATGVTGHLCDIVLGFLILPISRNSLIGKSFGIGQSTILSAHKILGWAFLVVTSAHLVSYYAFVAESRVGDEIRKNAFVIDNPALTDEEHQNTNIYFSLTLPIGMLAFVCLLLILITSLQRQRRLHYNLFYYTHFLGSILIFIFSSLHASTDFYFLLPGLALWAIDWTWRLFYGSFGLSRDVTGIAEDAKHGWLRITLPSTQSGDSAEKEKSEDRHPLETYYITVPEVSKLQNHAFSAARVESGTEGTVFLFQTAQPIKPKKPKKQAKEWTWKLETHIQNQGGRDNALRMRVEGPYIPTASNGFVGADHIICLVGGTGVTGALSLARWWLDNQNSHTSHFTLIWTVRNRETSYLEEWKQLETESATRINSNMDLIVHVSSEEGRVDAFKSIEEAVGSDSGLEDRTWVYASGPVGLLKSVENACIDWKQNLKGTRRNLEYYVAKWEV